jgi:hypothetical protein
VILFNLYSCLFFIGLLHIVPNFICTLHWEHELWPKMGWLTWPGFFCTSILSWHFLIAFWINTYDNNMLWDNLLMKYSTKCHKFHFLLQTFRFGWNLLVTKAIAEYKFMWVGGTTSLLIYFGLNKISQGWQYFVWYI